MKSRWLVAGAVVIGAGFGVLVWTASVLATVNEPKIEARHHQEVAKRFPELIADDATDVTLRYRYLDSPVDVFTYRSSATLETVFQKAEKAGWGKVGGIAGDVDRLTLVLDSPDSDRWMEASHVWAKGDGRIVVAVYQDERFLTDAAIQERIRNKTDVVPK